MDNTSLIRLSIFLGVFLLMAVLEALLPARHDMLGRKVRWVGNLSMVIIGALVSRIFLPATLVGVSIWARQQEVGLFNVVMEAALSGVTVTSSFQSGEPLQSFIFVAVVILSILLFDMIIYWQHRLFHTVPLLWRFHRVHHTDSHVDTSTGLRFHPVEIVISLGIKAATVVVLGIPVIAVVIFEVALNGFALFNHANVRLPQQWDKRVGLFFITQRLHRIHHSQSKNETNSNYGATLSWWDRLFSSFKPIAEFADEILPIGQKDVPVTRQNSSISALLSLPFKSK